MRDIKHIEEPYLKENNLLQLSLFDFSRRIVNKTVTTWEDENGKYSLKCTCDYGVPGSREQDCYTSCMRIWVKRGMVGGKIEVSYSDVARELGVAEPKNVVGKIKESLRRLGAARYEFVQCFVKADKNGNKKVTTQFSLFDSTSLYEHKSGLSKKDSKSVLVFPDIIRENLEAKYYQYLDMAWYRNLPEGLSRRLYEYLVKRRYHCKGETFVVSEKSICRWLPINDKHATNRKKRLEEITSSLVDKGFLRNYDFNARKRLCIFVYCKNARPPKSELAKTPKYLAEEKQDNFLFENECINDELEMLCSLVNSTISQKLKAVIEKYHKKQGFDYVKWNILYTNKHSKKRYSTYLQKALAENWGDEFQEEKESTEKESIKQQKELEEEQKELERKQKQLEDLKQKFKEKVKELDPRVKIKLMQKAEKGIPDDVLGRGMNVKIEYSKLVLSCINKESKNKFPDSTIAELGFIKEVFFL